jgi:hypothetical protein
MSTSKLIISSTTIDKMTDNFFGSFVILPGQFTLLDNQVLEITKDHLRIIISGTPNKILDYSIANSKLQYYEGRPLNAMEIRIDSLNKFNVVGFDETVNLITNLLYLRPPSVIYLTYEPDMDVFTLKNINMATLAILKKIK